MILFFILLSVVSLQAQGVDSVPAPASGKRVLIYTLNVLDAKRSVAEGLTEALYLEMANQSGIQVGFIRDEVKKEDVIAQHAPLLKMALSCNEVECAATLAKELGYDYSLLGTVQRKGGGYSLQMQVVTSSDLSIAFEREEIFRSGSKREVIRALPTWGGRIAGLIAKPGFGIKTSTDKAKTGWRSANFDPFTAHLTGTRIMGTYTDTLKRVKSPYIVTSNLMVPPGAVLVIEEGVTIYVGGEYTTITVMGQIMANGTKENPIYLLSGKQKPAAWDWDRLFFRSKQRSVLNYMHIQNSNYGIVVKNGAVTLSHCVLSKNSVRALYVENSDVEILDSEIKEGHLIGIQVGEYGQVAVERSTIIDNHNAISVLNFGELKLLHSRVENNDRGLILVDSVALTMENSQITRNRIGVITNNEISRSMFLGLKGNIQNLEPVKKEKIASLIEKPSAVEQKREIKKDLAKDHKKVEEKKDFKGGITSVRKTGPGKGIIGNVTLGMEYHIPRDVENTTNRDIVSGKGDTVNPGLDIPQDKVIPGFRQTASVFTTIDYGTYSIDANFDMLWDKWGNLQLEALSARTQVGAHALGVGDFTESGSEITVSSSNIRGVKYDLGLFENRREQKRFRVSGIFGESERPYDVGDKVLGSYLERKSEGSAVAQKLLGIGKMNVMANENWNLNFNYVYSKDRREGVLRPDLAATSVLAQVPLVSNMVGLESEWRFLKEALTLSAEINVGTVDSTTQAYNLALKGMLDNPAFDIDAANKSNLTSILQPTATAGFVDSNMAEALKDFITTTDSNNLDTNLTDDARSSLLNARRLSLLDSIKNEISLIEPDIQDSLDDSKFVGLRWEGQGVAARLAANFEIAGTAFEGSYSYIGASYYTGGNPFLTQDQRRYEFSFSRDLLKNLNINSRYSLYIENASSDGLFYNFLGFGEGSDIGLLSDEKWQQYRENADFTRPKFTNKLDVKSRYNATPILEFNFNYALSYKSQIKPKTLNADSTILLADSYFAPGGSGSETILYNNYGYSADQTRLNEYRNDTPSDSIPLASVLEDKNFDNTFGIKAKVRFSKFGSVQMGGKWKLTNDISSYKYSTLLNKYHFQDSTLASLGYYTDGEDEFKQDYDAALTLKNKVISNKLDGKLGLKSKIKRNEDTFEWRVKNNFQWKIIKRKLRMEFSALMKKKVIDSDEERHYIEENGSKRYFYRLNDTVVVLTPDELNTKVISQYEPADSMGVIHKELYRPKTRETDFELELKIRYNFNSKLYSETIFKQLLYLRPDQLDQQYNDLVAEVKIFYSF